MRLRSRTRLLRCAGAAVLVAWAAAAAASGTAASAAPAAPAASADPAMPEEVLAAARAAHPDVPVAELYRRLALTAPRGKLLQRFVETYPETFGGSWYDYDEGVWHLMATDAGTLTAMTAEARAAGVEVRPRLVRYGLAALHARADHIVAGRDPLSALGRAAGVDVPANRVTFATTRAFSTDPMVTFVPPAKNGGSLHACTSRRECGAPLRTGIIIWYEFVRSDGVVARGNSCSLGFVAGASDGSRWALTAGHCVGGINQKWGHGAQYFGPVRQCFQIPVSETDQLETNCTRSPDTDVARIRIDNPYWLMYGFGYLFHEPNVTATVDGAVTSLAQIEVGEFVCLSAWHSSYTGYTGSGPEAEVNTQPCGRVKTVRDPDPDRIGMTVVSGAVSCQRDSGGGWVHYPGGYNPDGSRVRIAYGINRGGSDPIEPGLTCSDGAEAWFTNLPTVNSTFDHYSPGSNIRVITR